MLITEKLIECVKNHPILYDTKHPEYKNLRMKDKVWYNIGRQLDEDREELKKKWKNIKDCYQKHLRTINAKTGEVVKRSYKNWQWAPLMEFYRKQTESSIGCNKFKNETENDAAHSPREENTEGNFDNDTEEAPSHETTVRRKHKRSLNECATPFADSLPSKKQLIYTADAIDLIFLGYSNTIKTFSPVSQATVKMRVARVIMEEELKNLEEISPVRSTSCSTRSKKRRIGHDDQPCSSSSDFTCPVKVEELQIKPEDPERQFEDETY